MKRFAKYVITAVLCAAIILGVIVPGALPVKAAAISGKTGIGMAEWAWKAYREKWDYKYGGSSAGAVDCSGLIRSYCNGKGGGAKDLVDAASVKGNMNSIPRIHGLGLWLNGHAGVYVGRDENGVDMAIDSRNKNKDMQYDELYGNYWPVWVKWFKIDMISYPTTGWYEYDGNTYYYHDGEFVVGKFTVDGVTYDFGKSGICKGEATEDTPDYEKTVTITAKSTTVRSGAGADESKVGTAYVGEKYQLLETKKVSSVKWYKIKFTSSKNGWVSSSYARADQQEATESTVPEENENRLKVTGGTVNVRTGAGASNSKITTVFKGDEFVYTDSAAASNGTIWYKIILSSSKSGWISGTYVELIEVPVGTNPTTTTTKATDKTTKATTDSTTAATTTTTASTTTTTKKTTTTTAKPAQNKLQITGAKVNVRKGAGTSYSVVTTVKKGGTYVFTATKTVSGKKWYKITVGSKSGWVIGTYVKVVSTATTTKATTTTTKATTTTTKATTKSTTAKTTTTTKPTTTTTKKTTTTTAKPAQNKLQITGKIVNVRKGAGTSYGVVTTVKKGGTYVFTATKTVSGKKWYKITVGSKSGWVIGTYVKVVSTATTTKATTTTTKATTKSTTAKTTTTTKPTTTTTKPAQNKLQITGKIVNVRKGAGTNYDVVTTVLEESIYEFTDTKTVSGKVWYKISVEGETGWVIGTYAKVISGSTTAATTTTTKATTTTTKAASKKVKITGEVVNVRKSAGTGYAVVTTVKKGSTYTYTSTKTVSGKVWYKITVGSKSGWIIGTYAKKV